VLQGQILVDAYLLGMGGRSGYLVAVVVLGLATAVPAVAEKSAHRDVAQPIGVFHAHFSPSALPKTRPAPARFTVTANFKPAIGHPPPLKELRLKLDRHARLSLEKTPTAEDVPGCSPGSGPPRSLGETRKACGPAVVGNGRMDVEVQFPDVAPVPVESRLVALNGGIEAGKAKIYFHSYFSAPISGAIVTTMEVEKIREERYGLEATATFPKIAGGNGSITSLALSLKRGVLSASCPDGRHDFYGKAVFADNTHLGHRMVSPCAARTEARR
jgi:hypothetical protein